jgi:hypothetical protein
VELPLGALEEGEYRLKMTATDDHGGPSISRAIDFEVVRTRR